MKTYNDYMLSKTAAEAQTLMKRPEAMYEAVVRDTEHEMNLLRQIERTPLEDYKQQLQAVTAERDMLKELVRLVKANHDGGFIRLPSKILHMMKRMGL